MTDKKLNIYQRINAVMNDVQYVQKDAIVQSYKAVTHDQVTGAIRKSIVKNGIVIYPEQLTSDLPIMKDGANIKMHLYTADYAIHFVNVDSPEDRISVTINAHANDNGDKAPGKACSYATKTAILKVFSLETGENDESRFADEKLVSAKQMTDLSNLLCQLPDDRQAGFLRACNVNDTSEITDKAFPKAFKQLSTAVKQLKEQESE